MWFDIATLYETTNHTYSYSQFTFHKLSVIKFFDKNTDDATIGVVFNKFITVLREYEHVGRTPELMDDHTCLTLISSIVKPVANVLCYIKIYKKVDN